MAALLLNPTIHVEVQLARPIDEVSKCEIRELFSSVVKSVYTSVRVGQVLVEIVGFLGCETLLVGPVVIADHTGPPSKLLSLEGNELDIQFYTLKDNRLLDQRRQINQRSDDDEQARILDLPNVLLVGEWESLIYDDALPSQLLRYLTRMLDMMKTPGVDLSIFNWNRVCLLHGPAGSGKSTLCRALAQKLSIRLSQSFPSTVLVEVNTNAMLSKYFGESGKLIGKLFDRIRSTAQSNETLVIVVMDEVETLAGSRERVSNSGECADSLRVTNQLLTNLDRIRTMPNIIVLCTSNLISAIDPAFLNRVDVIQFIPSPSPAAIYNIFRSGLNELLRVNLIGTPVGSTDQDGSDPPISSFSDTRPDVYAEQGIPTFDETQIIHANDLASPGQRVWALAQKCEGFSGRELRRLPILGLAMYTWGDRCWMTKAISALEAAVEQNLVVKQGERKEGVVE